MRLGKATMAALLAIAAQVSFAPHARAATEDASAAIERQIAAAGIRPDQYGLVVLPLGAGTLRAEHEPDRPLNPASTMKLLTGYLSP